VTARYADWGQDGDSFAMNKLSAPLSFFLLCGVAVAVEWRALAATFSIALNREEYTQILLVLPIVAALIFLDQQGFKAPPKPALRWGSAIFLVSVTVAALAAWASGLQPDARLALDVLALVVWWVGAFVLCFGASVARTFLFPLGFLLWLVPIPAFMLSRIILFLQQWSAFAAQAMFSSAGVPVSQDGLLLTIPGVTLQVAKECSSIRSSLMLMMTTMVLAQLFLRSPWRRALLIALAIPLSVAKNGLRIFTIGMLGTKVDPSYLTGRLHHRGGSLFLLIALLAVLLLLVILRKGEQRSAPVSPRVQPLPSTPR
jgi:exosortase